MSPSDLQRLLRVLEQRDIDLGDDEVGRAFKSEQTGNAMSSWVQEYLAPSCLLTKEELTFSETKNSSVLSAPLTSRTVSDSEFEAAISTLEATTATIEKQCRLLETQKRALEDIRARNASEHQVEEAKSNRQTKFQRNVAQLDIATSELASSLQSQLQTSIKESDSASTAIPTNVERILDRDDRLLDGLDKILPQLSGMDDVAAEPDQTQTLCDALITLSAAEIRSKIDGAYNAAARSIMSQSNGINGTHGSTEQPDALRAELDELCLEIDGLTAMAVEAHYRNPISRATQSAKSESEDDRIAWSEYVTAALQYLTARVDTLSLHFAHLQSHGNALKTVSAALDGVLARAVEAPGEAAPSGLKPSQKGLKPLRLVQANLSETQEPTAQFLRYMDIKSADLVDNPKFAVELKRAVADKKTNVSSLSRTSEQTISESLSQSLAKVNIDLEHVHSAVYAHSAFGSIRLRDARIEEGISNLEDKTEILSKQMKELDIDSVNKTVKLHQQALMRKRNS